jgi:DNA-binding NarL/FixJ family response regulator
MAEPMRVIIAEDNYLVREGTRRLLEDSGEVDVIAAVGTAGELLDAVRRFEPDVVLTDIRMPPGHHMEGIDAAHAIRAGHPAIGVAVLSQHTDESYALALFRDGTSGLAYLLKDRLGDLEELIRALRAVMAGGSVIDPQVVEALVARRSRTAQSPLGTLTPRELDVLRVMAQGRDQCRHRAQPAPVGLDRGKARQLDLRQTPARGCAGPPPGGRSTDVPS